MYFKKAILLSLLFSYCQLYAGDEEKKNSSLPAQQKKVVFHPFSPSKSTVTLENFYAAFNVENEKDFLNLMYKDDIFPHAQKTVQSNPHFIELLQEKIHTDYRYVILLIGICPANDINLSSKLKKYIENIVNTPSHSYHQYSNLFIFLYSFA